MTQPQPPRFSPMTRRKPLNSRCAPCTRITKTTRICGHDCDGAQRCQRRHLGMPDKTYRSQRRIEHNHEHWQQPQQRAESLAFPQRVAVPSALRAIRPCQRAPPRACGNPDIPMDGMASTICRFWPRVRKNPSYDVTGAGQPTCRQAGTYSPQYEDGCGLYLQPAVHDR